MLTVTDSKSGKSYEVVDYRKPYGGETYLSANSNVLMCTSDEGSHGRPILKPIKWRAEEGELFYYVTTDSVTQVLKALDAGMTLSNGCYELGNYYSSEAEAQVVADKINKIFDEG